MTTSSPVGSSTTLTTILLVRGVLAPFAYIGTDIVSDTMHLILAINPFVLLSIAFGAAAFRNWFRVYSILTILILVVLATLEFSYVPAVAANQPTSWLGLSERIAQYAHQLWHAALAIVLLRRWS